MCFSMRKKKLSKRSNSVVTTMNMTKKSANTNFKKI